MNPLANILFKSLIKPYYKQNAGLFAFLIFIMFAAVGRANEAGLLEYHYSLIRALLINPVILIGVFTAWFLYAQKCEQFVAQTLSRQDHAFLDILCRLRPLQSFGLLLIVQFVLFLPVSLYSILIIGVALYHHWYAQLILVCLYILALCLLTDCWYVYLLYHPGKTWLLSRWRIPAVYLERFYPVLFVRYILKKRKLLYFVIKLYSCGILYLMVVNQTTTEHDLGMIILFYSFGLFGHGVLIHRLRNMEETGLFFYRGLAVSIVGRYLQYAGLYFFLFIPEMMTIGWLTPYHLQYSAAFLFVFFGYSVLLLLNSLLFIRAFSMLDYLKILVGIFFMVFIGVLTGFILWFATFSIILSGYVFSVKYYHYEQKATG